MVRSAVAVRSAAPAEGPAALGNEPVARRLFNRKWLYLMLLPCLANFVIFHYWPMYGLQIAFKRFNIVLGAGASPWIGLEHFVNFFSSYYFWEVLGNTLRISLLSIAIGFPFPILFALVLNEVQNPQGENGVSNDFLFALFPVGRGRRGAGASLAGGHGGSSIGSCRLLWRRIHLFSGRTAGISSRFIW